MPDQYNQHKTNQETSKGYCCDVEINSGEISAEFDRPLPRHDIDRIIRNIFTLLKSNGHQDITDVVLKWG